MAVETRPHNSIALFEKPNSSHIQKYAEPSLTPAMIFEQRDSGILSDFGSKIQANLIRMTAISETSSDRRTELEADFHTVAMELGFPADKIFWETIVRRQYQAAVNELFPGYYPEPKVENSNNGHYKNGHDAYQQTHELRVDKDTAVVKIK